MSEPYFLMPQHPVTTGMKDAERQIQSTIDAVNACGEDTLVILPNNDAGYSPIMKLISASNLKNVETLSIDDYVNLLRNATGLVGNSSSGIHEAASFNVPVVNIGTRQQGRLRPNNVIDVGYNKSEILDAMRKCQDMRDKNVEYENPYGDGKSAEKIVKLLKKISLDESILQKRITY